MDQDRIDAQNWATEWAIRQKNKKIICIVIGILLAAFVYFAITAVKIYFTRTIFRSEAEMKEAMQGSFKYEDYQEIDIVGDKVYFTYFNVKDEDSGEYNEYTKSYTDNTYDDVVVKWHPYTGTIECDWLGDYTVDTKVNLTRNSTTFIRQ
ncbi:MAG: hypothetical protein KBS63_02230 [Clostridiales bacterium]|nr:hypothetical protein [Candidatus Crickella caballi]